MHRARHNLEEQVGGLIDHDDRRRRRRTGPPLPSGEEVPARYGLTARATPTVRATRASDGTAERRVA
jgi:hypothetical protein